MDLVISSLPFDISPSKAFLLIKPTDSTLLNATYLPPLDSFQNLARLAERDRLNVQYAKEELNEGDTLVFVQHPNGRRIQDQNGFELRGRYIVHAENLKATGSEYFTSRLESREHQLKLQRRFGLVGRLPDGIQYLLDLKPPEVRNCSSTVASFLVKCAFQYSPFYCMYLGISSSSS
jgi:hypothetical protein